MATARPYEVTLVFHPNLDEAAFTAALDKCKGWMTSAGGTVTQTNVWGRRRLAYPINKLTEGQYVLFLANLPAQALSGLEREFRLNEEILRFLIVRVEE
jgi:small subunit ribosomal protein S6